jgi:hypothetical protein
MYDADAGVPLACVEVRNLCADPTCPPRWGIGEVGSACEVRPWVYRTPLLFDLIKGCQNDLARIESVRWGDASIGASGWPDEVSWDILAGGLRAGPQIAFTKPVRADTVRPGSIFLTAILWERQADYLLTRRIPAALQPLDERDGYATRYRLQVNAGWMQNEIESRSELKGGGRLELTVRGQMIRDRCDNMLDAVPLDYAPASPPQSRPGGDFVALVRFAAETRTPPPPPEPDREAPPSDEV